MSDGATGFDVTTDPAIDFKPKVYEHPSYRYNQLLQVTGGQTQPLSTSAITWSNFELPTRVFNLSKSILSFRLDQTVVSGVAVTGGTDINSYIFAQGLPMIDRLSLYTRSGQYLCDLVNCNFYTNLVAPYTTSKADAEKSQDAAAEWTQRINLIDTVPNPMTFTDSSFPVRDLLTFTSNRLTTAATDAQTVYAATTNITTRDGGNRLLEPLSGMNQGLIPRQRYDTVTNPDTYTQLFSLQYVIELGKIPNCIFSMNKDMFFGETMILQIFWAPTNQIANTCYNGNIAQAVAPVAINAQLSNLALYLATENNQNVAQAIVNKVSSPGGMVFTVPYVYTNRYINPSGQNVSVQVRLNRGHGKNLMNCYNGVYAPGKVTETRVMSTYSHKSGIYVGTAAAALARNMVFNPYWNYVYTLLDNERLQELNMNQISPMLDYTWQMQNFKDSSITNIAEWRYNWAWVDNWTGLPLCMKEAAYTQCGLDLEQERLYTFFLNINPDAAAAAAAPWTTDGFITAGSGGYANVQIFQFFVVQKTLRLSLNNIVIV